jgi:hypothetical protein
MGPRESSAGGWRFEALASGLVAMLALVISAYTVYVQRQQLKVQAWPRLTVVSEVRPGTNPGEMHVTFSLKNRGVAPAEVRAMRLTFAGEDMTDWQQWLARIKEKHDLSGALPLSRVSPAPLGEIIGVGDEYILFAADSARTAAAIISATDDTSMAFCYCSVLDDCWLLDLPPGASSPVTRSVERCLRYDTKFVGARIEDSQKWAERILDGREAGGGDAAAEHPHPR